MNEDEREKFYVACCNCCTLASVMRDCKSCLFKIGLTYKILEVVKSRLAAQEAGLKPSADIKAGYMEILHGVKF